MKTEEVYKPVILKMQSFLSRRDHSEQELKTKLLRSFAKQEVDFAIALAYEKRWLKTPIELAQQLVEELHQKRKGWLYILHALKKKGLPEISCDEEKEEEKCRWWIEKKFSTIKNPSLSEKQKVIRFFTNKGFSQSVSHKVFEECFNSSVF